MRPVTLPWVLLVTALAGCHREPTPDAFPLRSVVLHDVQGLRGGRALWAGEGGAAVVQVVGKPPPGQDALWERRYEVRLTADQWAEVGRLVEAHHFLTLKVPERRGIPDESHPVIAVVTKAGATARAMKWAGDEHPDFDPVYRYLLDLCRGAEAGKPVHEGKYDWEWRPEGFDSPW